MKSAVKVCLETEKVLQRRMKLSGNATSKGQDVHNTVASAVLKTTADLHLFEELFSHQFETPVEDNHVHLLIRRIAAFYARSL